MQSQQGINMPQLIVLLLVPSLPLPAIAQFHATNENGVRVFSKVPEPGVHPRVLLSPSDLPAWRKHVITTYRGKTFFAKRFESKRIDKLIAIESSVTGDELLAAYPHEGSMDNHDLLFATLDVVYHDDAARAKEICKGLANFARIVMARQSDSGKWGEVEDNIGAVKGLKGIKAGLGHLWYRGGSDFPLAYDFLYDYMTEEQRNVCREAISLATKDLTTWGMGFPRGRAISNWYGYHGELGPMMINFTDVHFYETGGSIEDGYSGNVALREGQFSLIAMARRGENFFDRKRFRKYWEWGVQSLVPGEGTGATVAYSSARLAPYESSPVLAKWAVPSDPILNYYFRQFKGADYELHNKWQYAPISTLLCMNYNESRKQPLDLAKLELPITAVFEPQGLFIARSDWSDEAAYLNILGRQDAWYDRHENVDRGRFVFASHGRQWCTDRPWADAKASTDHSLVHIDGLAQIEAKVGRGKAPNARLIHHGETDNIPSTSYAVYDLKNAYDWMWSHSWDQPKQVGDAPWEPETRTFEELGWKWKRPGQPATLHGSDNRDSPQYNFEGQNLWRSPYNPVKYCWRTAVMVREETPYVLIVDDVKKDDEERTYDWYFPVPDDVEMKRLPNRRWLLTEKDEQQTDGKPNIGSRRLLIQLTDFYSKTTAKIESYVSGKRRDKEIMSRRVIISRPGTEAHFAIVLYPFRTTQDPTDDVPAWKSNPLGAPTPKVLVGTVSKTLVVGENEWKLTKQSDGRTHLVLDQTDAIGPASK